MIRVLQGAVTVPMVAAAAWLIVVEAWIELRAVLGRLPSRDLESGDRGAPGLPGHVAQVGAAQPDQVAQSHSAQLCAQSEPHSRTAVRAQA